MTPDIKAAVAGSIAAVAESLDEIVDVSDMLHLICLAAIDSVPGADFAGITVADRDGGMSTVAATHAIVREVDALQYELAQGPCVDAIRGHWQARAGDLAADSRWPRYGLRAASLGIRSQLGIELFDEPGTIAGLNLYSRRTGAFDDDTVEAAMMFAIQAAHTLGRVITQKQVTDAMTTRTAIGQATGVIMERFGLTPERAFELLTRVARIHDITIETVAQHIIDEISHIQASAG